MVETPGNGKKEVVSPLIVEVQTIGQRMSGNSLGKKSIMLLLHSIYIAKIYSYYIEGEPSLQVGNMSFEIFIFVRKSQTRFSSLVHDVLEGFGFILNYLE